MFRVRQRLNIRLRAEWDALPEHDKDDWLAYDWLQQRRVESLMDMLVERSNNDKSTEVQNYVSTYLAKWDI